MIMKKNLACGQMDKSCVGKAETEGHGLYMERTEMMLWNCFLFL